MYQKLITVLVSAACGFAISTSYAQAPAASSSASSASSTAPTVSSASTQIQPASTPAKKVLVARILKIQQPMIEGMSRAMAERPAQAVMEKAGVALASTVPADKREAAAKDVEGLVKKYLDEAVPLVTSRAIRLAPTTVGTLLEDKFNEADLKQLLSFLESPIYNKYQQLGGDMQKTLLEKLLADTRGAIEPKVVALDQAVGKRLGAGAPAVSPATR